MAVNAAVLGLRALVEKVSNFNVELCAFWYIGSTGVYWTNYKTSLQKLRWR